MSEINLPHRFELREYQRPLWRYLEGGGRRAIICWHRRAGKDLCCLHWLCTAAFQTVGVYWFLLPELSMARKVAWDAIDAATGVRLIDAVFPRQLRESTHEQDMRIKLKSGSLVQFAGSDNYHSLVGSGPRGIDLSEFSRAVPEAYGYLLPILAANDGWMIANSTPLGKNAFHTMLTEARGNPKWFSQVVTAAESGAIKPEALEETRREFIGTYGSVTGRALFEQEFLCSFESVIPGSYYAEEMTAAGREGRITTVEVDKDLPVHSAWDLGIDDATAIWCFQVQPGRLHVVDHYEASGYAADHYADWLNSKGYHGTDWVPHDARVREWSSGRTRPETLRLLKRKPRLVPDHTVIDGINAARKTLALTYFDNAHCARGIDALRAYQSEWDEHARTFKKTPKHDWSSHSADAFRYLSMAWKEPVANDEEPTEADIVKQICAPRTFNQVYAQFIEERYGEDYDPDRHGLLELN